MNLSPAMQRAGRSLAPLLAHVFLRRPLVKPLALLEAYLAFIQGKGSGTGWDMEAEAHVASSYIRRPDAVIFDVGAHHGKWSCEVLRLLGPKTQCRIFQFEPLKYNQSVLHSLNLPRTTVIEAAVSGRSGKATIHSPDAWSPVASLHMRRDSELQKYHFVGEEVEVVTIDETMDRFGVDAVDFMKLDVEGSELALLQGSHRALQAKRIAALSFEFGCGNINSRTYFHDFWDLLQGYGYTIQRICPGGILLQVKEYYEDLEYFRGVTNYLATAEP